MQTQMQGQQPHDQPSRLPKGKLPHWVRPVVIIVALIFLTTDAVIWIWSIWGHIPEIMSAIFTIIGVTFAFLALPFLYHSDNPQSLPITPADSSSPTLPGIFFFNELLPHPGEFFGRTRERTILTSRTRKGNSTSIVGPRRIGKTWLMTYLKLVASSQVGSSFQLGYLDASLPKCRTVAGFTAKALEVLHITAVLSNSSTVGLNTLQEAVENLRNNNQIPVLCIDEFESLLDSQEFDLNFFSGLRAITQVGLCLVIASKSPLIDLVSESVKTSPFFNIFEQIKLRPFSIQEAEVFAKAKATRAGFTDKERTYLLEYVREDEQQRIPLRLQLRGKMLLEDKIAAQNDPESYLPTSQIYWRNFEKRLDETLQAVLR